MVALIMGKTVVDHYFPWARVCAKILIRAIDEAAYTPSTIPKDLLSLGLASKIFLKPALDGLWKRIESIVPLLLVLPETTVVNGKKLLLGPIAPLSWDCLHFYTSHVHEFTSPECQVLGGHGGLLWHSGVSLASPF
ncbi:hypothetical protein BDP27DRAFT_1373763 [Rhodocollybia butyracea]|uniref:Uncharacterized protein n=1 Tax=Rhodocollybia butyracea TaxID=206335 RepID=A0A9P5TWF8_9AGAR|nr:hypothetical protein BDP27DRAFT_1373763 [Rhodocollybia butyracea]